MFEKYYFPFYLRSNGFLKQVGALSIAMRQDPFDSRDGFRVWLSDDETAALIEKMEDRGGTSHHIAARLGVHCGLRREEASCVRAVDVVEDLGKTNLRVPEAHAKLDKYRETPIPRDLADRIKMIPEYRSDLEIDDSVLDVSAKTLNRWVKRACEQLHAETNDDGWLNVTYHDLRRTWGTRLLEHGVLPSVVMVQGGWESWPTFRDSYLGEFSPHALKRERNKVPWLGGESMSEQTQTQVQRQQQSQVPPAFNRSF